MAENAEFTGMATELLNEFGSSFNYVQDAIVRSSATGDITSRTPTTTSVTAHLFQGGSRYEAPELTETVDVMALVLPIDGLTPAIGDRMTVDGAGYKVLKIDSDDVNGVPIVYILYLCKN